MKVFVDCISKIITFIRNFRVLIVNFLSVLSYFSGFGPSIQYIFIYRGAYYGLFDSAKVFAPSNEKKQISFLSAFIIGQVIGPYFLSFSYLISFSTFSTFFTPFYIHIGNACYYIWLF